MSDFYPIINKKLIRSNKLVRKIQKENIKQYKHIKGKYPKVKIGKIAALVTDNAYYDFTQAVQPMVFPDIKDIHELLLKLDQYNITGMSGNGFPASNKIKTFMASACQEKYIVINAVECDPGLVHDSWLLMNRYEYISSAANFLNKELGAKRIILASKSAPPANFQGTTTTKSTPNSTTKSTSTSTTQPTSTSTTQYASSSHTKLFMPEIYLVPNRYPMGAEHILIKEVLGINLPAKDIPAEHGVLVINLQTIETIGEILLGQYKPNTRYITVADYTYGQAAVAKVVNGMSVMDILQKIFGSPEGEKAYAGLGAMGAIASSPETIVSPITNMLCYSQDFQYSDPIKCKKCGACSRKCPMSVSAKEIIQSFIKKQSGDLSKYNIDSCIGCATCNYYCRAGINVADVVLKVR